MSSGSNDKFVSTAKPGTGPSVEAVTKTWPDSLEKFVEKCLIKSKLLSPKDKLAVQRQMQELVTSAETEGKLYTNDWSKQKLPVLDKGAQLVLYCDLRQQNGLGTEPHSNGSGSSQFITAPGSIPETSGPKSVSGTGTSSKRKSKYDSEDKKRQRLERFSSEAPTVPSLPAKPDFSASSQSNTFVGTCQTLEKRYLRLTSEPDPRLVRPQNILQKATKRLLDLVDEKPYSYIKDQFKAIRQDMTVQHLKNDFTMYVYETNARISIKNNDLGEMNQCVTQLEYFFDSKTVRNSHLNSTELEFMCYRILYMLMVENHSEIFKIKYKILNRSYDDPHELDKLKYVKLSFQLHELSLASNYYGYFKLVDEFKGLPLAYTLIVNFLMEKQKLKALNILVKSYRKFSLDLVASVFNSSVDEVTKFLEHHKLHGFVQNNDIDCTVLRPHVVELMARTNFKRIDIKGQV